MIDNSLGGVAYNRFKNLDSIEDRIIYYLISPNNKTAEELEQTHVLWKLLYYNDIDALNKPLPSYSQVAALIADENETQTDKRIFRTPHKEAAWTQQCSLIDVYIDSIEPTNRLVSVVNIGIDCLTHNKTINVYAEGDKEPPIDVVDGMEIKIQSKSRISLMTRAVLALLNGAEIQGVGKITFSYEMSRFNQAQYALWNNRSLEGIKLVMGVNMSGVS